MEKKVTPGGFEARRLAGKTTEGIKAASERFRVDVEAIAAAVLREFAAGTDIGEVIFYALKVAQIDVAEDFDLLDNRPGSWEAANLQAMMDAVHASIAADRESLERLKKA
jgi:hypothetical protein